MANPDDPANPNRRPLLMLIVAAAAIAAISGSFYFSFLEINRLAEVRQVQTLRNAVAQQGRSLARELKMQTVWGDAFKNTTLEPNAKWMNDFYGVYLSGLLGYDRIYVLSGADRPIYGFTNSRADIADFRVDQEAFHDLIDAVRSSSAAENTRVKIAAVDLGGGHSAEHRSISDVRMVHGEPANVVVETIVPDADPGPQVRIPERPSLLVATFTLDPSFVRELGDEFGFADLRWSRDANGGRDDATVIAGADGRLVGRIAWSKDLPGQILLKHMSGGFAIALLLLLGLAAIATAAVRAQARKMIASRLKEAKLARTDFVTGLPNRLALSEAFPQMLAKAIAQSGVVGVISIDLDGFKDINDTMGHHAGDAALAAIGERIVSVFPDCLFARTGGDEFVGILVAETAEHVLAVAEKAVRILKAPLPLPEGLTARLGGSVGYAVGPVDGADATDLLRRSDLALFKAKREGRNRAVAFEPVLELGIVRRKVVEAALRRAVRMNDVGVAYQPLYGPDGKTILGVEALARLRDNTIGVISPAHFIPVAEETGLIVELGEQILWKAVKAAADWGDLTVAVNVSARQIHNSDFVDTVWRVLADTGFPACRLEIELTESILIADEPRADQQIKALRKLGVRVALDDFGTGYASLLYLRRFGFDKLKIDQQFVRDIESDGDARVLVQSVMSMSQALGLTVTAEGVESQGQHDFLRANGCDRLQGFLFSVPLSQMQMQRLIAEPIAA